MESYLIFVNPVAKELLSLQLGRLRATLAMGLRDIRQCDVKLCSAIGKTISLDLLCNGRNNYG